MGEEFDRGFEKDGDGDHKEWTMGGGGFLNKTNLLLGHNLFDHYFQSKIDSSSAPVEAAVSWPSANPRPLGVGIGSP